MIWLIVVSIVWAFSFGMIKTNLAGLDSNFITFARLFLSFILFLPFLKIGSLSHKLKIHLILTGMIQYGLMYLLYIYSFVFLQSYEVALFTIFTPFFVVLIHDFFEKKFHLLFFINVIISIIGTFIIVFTKMGDSPYLIGFLLVQLSNLSFAFGQVFYKKILKEQQEIKDYQIFGLLYLGAVIISIFPFLIQFNPSLFHISLKQILTLIYLGFIASGVCFFLWNVGARKVNAGTLGIFNNVKIPLAVLSSVILFGESVNFLKLFIGLTLIICAILVTEWAQRRKSKF